MLRRMIALALTGLAVAAPPALASPQWNSQIKNASATASRSAEGCSIGRGSQAGSLLVTCDSHKRARLVYVFSTRPPAQGTATSEVSATGHALIWARAKVTTNSIRVTVTVCGDGSVQLNTISAGYYTG